MSMPDPKLSLLEIETLKHCAGLTYQALILNRLPTGQGYNRHDTGDGENQH